jgi:single-stranded DNA-binding protein
MKGTNRVERIASVVKPPEFHSLPSGLDLLKIEVASRERIVHSSGVTESSSYNRLKIFGNYATALQDALQVGQVIHVTGHLGYRNWQDDKGDNQYEISLIVDSLQSLEGDFAFCTDSKEQPVLLEGLNRVMLGGNLRYDATSKTIQESEEKSNFLLAVSGRDEQVAYFSIDVWNAPHVKRLSKGSPVFVRGRLRTDSWVKEDKSYFRTYIEASRVDVVHSGKHTSEGPTIEHDKPS